MTAMSVRDFDLARAIATIEAGGTVDISKDGRVIGELRPKAPVRDAAWYATYDRMIEVMREGLPLGVGKLTEDDKYGDAPLCD